MYYLRRRVIQVRKKMKSNNIYETERIAAR